jgi:hypothetical protein
MTTLLYSVLLVYALWLFYLAVMNRAAREALLLLIEREAIREFGVTDINAVRAGLYAGNPAYKRVKDIDNQIVALRAKL